MIPPWRTCVNKSLPETKVHPGILLYLSCLEYMYFATFMLWYMSALSRGWYGQYFADAIFKRIFLNEKLWIFINISLKFKAEIQLPISRDSFK